MELVALHEGALSLDILPVHPEGKRHTLLKKAGGFFAAVVAESEKPSSNARQVTLYLKRVIGILSQRTVELASTNQELNLEILRRKAAEEALKTSERHFAKALEQSDILKEQLRRLSRQVLNAQEDERKKISRELHDVIAQALMGINLRLATLKREVALSKKGLEVSIADTQRLITKTAKIVHQFARELRPTILDDLGLVPALHSYMKNFTARTGVRTVLNAFAGVEQLEMVPRTALFRVAQEALLNVGRHARASRVTVNIENTPTGIVMTVKDDGKSFDVQSVMLARGNKRLGLLGMRERVEMVGGTFEVESSPGEGTTITTRLPGKFMKNAPEGATEPVPAHT